MSLLIIKRIIGNVMSHLRIRCIVILTKFGLINKKFVSHVITDSKNAQNV